MEINRHAVELARMILDAACNGQSATDLDDRSAATIRSLSLLERTTATCSGFFVVSNVESSPIDRYTYVHHALTAGDPIQFCQRQQPPLEVLTWLHATDLNGVHGILVASLQRWHELRR